MKYTKLHGLWFAKYTLPSGEIYLGYGVSIAEAGKFCFELIGRSKIE